MNYLQYINSVYSSAQSTVDMRYLVSGVDSRVRQIVGQYIVNSVYDAGKMLFIVDSTKDGREFGSFGRFRVLNPLNGDVNLCDDLLEVSSLREISRLRSLLSELGFDGTRAMKVISYLSFVKETERRFGNCGSLRIETLEEYSGTVLVEWKLRQLVERGMLTHENYEYLLARYAEVSGAAADFEQFLMMLAPFIDNGCQPGSGSAVHFAIGEFASDRPMQEVMSSLMLAFIRKQPKNCAVLIIDDGKSDRCCILDILKNLPVSTDVHMFTADAFSLDDRDISVLMSTFPVRIYTRHDAMSFCLKIENCCGQVDVVKRAYHTAVDKRIRASTAFDLLLGTNRTDTEVINAPVREARYRKEMIHSLYTGTAIIDCGGTQTLFQF